jgi:hypothetical protein
MITDIDEYLDIEGERFSYYIHRLRSIRDYTALDTTTLGTIKTRISKKVLKTKIEILKA